MIKQIVAYLNAKGDRDASATGLLNWFSIERRDGEESVFDEDSQIKAELRDQYVDLLKELYDAEEAKGRAHDGMVMGVANDLIAQFEMAANFRTTRIGHHFAKSRYNIALMGNGAVEPKNSDSILEEYTSVFLENAVKYIS